MSETKIFITGVTGYIGGDLLFLINKYQPAWQVSCLVRDSSKASDLTARYPTVRVVLGDLDSFQIIEDEASTANIIYHCANCDHRNSALAIVRGIRRNQLKQVFWIHTSGTGILTHRNFALNNFESAEANDKIYDDWEHVDELTSLPDKALHRHVDKIVLGASHGHESRIKTAIVCPPAIYGLARGTGNVQSKQVNVAIKIALKNGRALMMGDGSNIWHGVHVHDLSRLYVMLGQEAVKGGGKASWNEAGYYLAENGAFKWGDIIQAIGDECQSQGYLSTNRVDSVNFNEAQIHDKNFPYLCGTTSRGEGRRARILFGWKPQGTSLLQELHLIVKYEAHLLGLRPHLKGML